MFLCGHSRQHPLKTRDIVRQLFRYYKATYDLFGCDRIIFESNFPMDKGSFSYVSYWNAMKIITGMLDARPTARRKLLFENANNVYKLELALPDLDLYTFSIASLL
jgi:L-fuconolactonase